jgi:hypothetical protein
MSKHATLTLGLVAIFLVAFSQIPARALVNIGQLKRLEGQNDQALEFLFRSLDLDPNNAHVRWQAASLLKLRGEFAKAAAVLSPVSGKQRIDPLITELLLTLLTVEHQQQEALRVYSALDVLPHLTASTAASILNSYLKSSDLPSPERTAHLLTHLFGWDRDTPEWQEVRVRLQDANFWKTEFASRVRSASVWRADTLGSAEAKSKEVVSLIDNHCVASMLSVPVENVKMGPELVFNGGFEQYDAITDNPTGWRPLFSTTGGICNSKPCNTAAFVSGLDSLHAFEGHRSLRIEGLSVEHAPERDLARAGFQYASPVTVTVGSLYVISFVYRTQGTSGTGASLWFSYPAVFSDSEIYLPHTQSAWRRVVIVDRNRSGRDATVLPLLHSYSEGNVWFDDFSIRRVAMKQPTHDLPQTSLIQISDPFEGCRDQ